MILFIRKHVRNGITLIVHLNSAGDSPEKFKAIFLCFYLPVANQLLSCSMEHIDGEYLHNVG